jgi:hypothetical protein
MLVTPEGIVTLVMPAHSAKACGPMAVTGRPSIVSGIKTGPVAVVG